MSKMRLLALSVITVTSFAAWIAQAQSSGTGARPGGAKDSATKDVGGKDAAPKDAAPKDAVPKDSVTKDSAVKDSASKELIERAGGRVAGFKGVDGVGTIKDSRGHAYTGRVARVDVEKRTITLKGLLPDPSAKEKGADVKQFRIAKEAVITLDGRVVKLGAIKTDAYVQVVGVRGDSEKSADSTPPLARSIEAFTRDPGPGGTGGGGATGGTNVTGGVGRPVKKDKDR